MAADLLMRGDGTLILTGSGKEFETLYPAFCRGNGAGLLALLRTSDEVDAQAGATLHFFRKAAREFAMQFIRQDGEGENAPVQFSFADALPSLTPDALQQYFRDFSGALQQKADQENISPADWIRQLHPAWKDLGKVTLHLAENKKDSDGTKPFAFLATCQHRITETGQVKHIPLATALKNHTGEKNVLLSMLTPLKEAAQEVKLLQDLIADNRIFKPCLFSAAEGWDFLKATEKFQAHGIPVRFSGLTGGKRPKRLKMDVTLDVRKKRGLLSPDALVDFSVGASIGDRQLTDEELQKILNTKGGLIRIKGEWVEAETERIKALLEQWLAASEISGRYGMTFFQAMRLLSRANGLENDRVPQLEEDICEVNTTPAFSEAMADLRDPEKTALPELSPLLEKILRPYQRDGVKFLWNMLNAGFGVCLADDMGLGKTLQMIACLTLFKEQLSAGLPALIVAPASLLANWKDEFAKFAPDLKVTVLHPSAMTQEEQMFLNSDPAAYLKRFDAALITYSLVPRREGLKNLHFPFIILDEAQQIKNPASQISRAVRSLHASKRVAMTGTPVENSLSDLWSIFDFICPALLGRPDSFRAFVKRMESAKPHPDYSPLRKLVRPYILHRLKSDKSIIADLPDKIERRERTALTMFQANFYKRTVDAMKKDLALTDEKSRNGVVLSYLLQFKQICNHPSQFSGNGDYPPERSGKFQRLGQLADLIAENGEKMIVFTQFKEMTEVLHEFLSAHFKRPGLILHGGTPVEKRAEAVQQFQNEQGPPFFVISLKAGGTGLNLTAASHVVHFDRWWNPAVENQATDRAYRIGQKKAVMVHKFVSPGTIEDRIDKLIAGKKHLADSLLEQGAAKLLTEMNDQELLDFVKLDMNSVEDDNNEI